MNVLFFAFSCIFVQNIVLVQYLGIDSFLDDSKKFKTPFCMGLIIIVVAVLSSCLAWGLQNFLLVPFSLEYLQLFVFVVVVAFVVFACEFCLKKWFPSLFSSSETFLKLTLSNCVILGLCLLSVQKNYTFINSLYFSFFSSLGFLLSLLLMLGIRERIASAVIPKNLKGLPITLISACIIAIAFYCFNGFI